MKRLRRLFNFLFLAAIKIWAMIFYRIEKQWINPGDEDPWTGLRLLVMLNHTSLYEALFLGAAPWRFIWYAAGKIVLPGADTTLKQPVAGTFYKLFSPKIIPISRERDATWDYFMEQIREDSLVMILPEGRMKRPNGLDKHGKPMTVRGGVADILTMIGDGKMLIVYSGGLHHVYAPGMRVPRLFKTLKMRVELIEIGTYIASLKAQPEPDFKKSVIADLQHRMESNCPTGI